MRRVSSWATEAVRAIVARARGDRGSASLEFMTVGLILLVPLVYLVLALSSIQQGSLAVEGAARQAARVYADAADEQDAASASSAAVRVALADAGLEPRAVRVACAPDPDDCFAAHALVTVEVTATVRVPLMPPVVVADVPVGVPMTASATQQVSRFAGAGG